MFANQMFGSGGIFGGSGLSKGVSAGIKQKISKCILSSPLVWWWATSVRTIVNIGRTKTLVHPQSSYSVISIENLIELVCPICQPWSDLDITGTAQLNSS